MDKPQSLSLEEVALSFLTSLSLPERSVHQQEVNRFLLWYGKGRPVSQLNAAEVARYADWVAVAGNPTKKLEPVKALLTYAKKEGFLRTNLAPHLRVGKGSLKVALPSRRSLKEPVAMTPQGYAQLESELVALDEERRQVAEELSQAAADKDFSENAPLDAAREHKEQVEARIRELEATIKSAQVVETSTTTLKVRPGSLVTLRNLTSGEELRYTLVSPSEVSPLGNKLSLASPTGRALLNQREGDIIEVSAPIGKLRYQIEKIEV